MGTLLLVRHGQASFGADDYDQLSELGARQCRRLGEYFRERGMAFDAVLTGTLRRHAQSLAALAEGAQWQPEPLLWPGLDEYDSHALVHAIHPEPLGKPLTPDDVKQHFRLLREGLLAWMAGRTQPQGMPSWAAFSAGVQGALDHVRAHHAGQKVLIVSSGGPISTAVAQVLGAPPEAAVALNMRLRNSALTEFIVTPKRHELVTFNHLPHLDSPTHAGWVTHA